MWSLVCGESCGRSASTDLGMSPCVTIWGSAWPLKKDALSVQNSCTVVVDFVPFSSPVIASYEYVGSFQKQSPATAPLAASRGPAMWTRTVTSLLVALQLSLGAQLALPRKTTPLLRTTSGLWRRSMPETSLLSVRSPGWQPRERPRQGGPFEEEQRGLGPRRKVSLPTRDFDAGSPRSDEILSSAAESLTKLSSMPTADFAGGLPRRAGRMRITRTDQLSRGALLRGGSSLLRGDASFVEEQASRPSILRDYARRRSVFEAAPGLATLPGLATRTARSVEVHLRLGLDSGVPTFYIPRHARLSDERRSGARPLPVTQRMGRWALESSARQHEESSRATSRLKDLPEELRDPAHLCDRHLECILDSSVAVPQLSPVLAKRRKLATSGSCLVPLSRRSL